MYTSTAKVLVLEPWERLRWRWNETKKVLPHLGLFDLVQLSQTCHIARNAVLQSPHIWVSARKRLCDMPGPPTALPAAGSWSELAYANSIFGPGLCIVCKEACDSLPVCFALRLRCCGRPQCEAKIERDNFLPKFAHWMAMTAVLSKTTGIIGLNRWIPSAYHPQDPSATFVPDSTTTAFNAELDQAFAFDRGVPVPENSPYAARTSQELREEWAKRQATWPLLVESHHALVRWSESYAIALADDSIPALNKQRVAECAQAAGLDLARMLGTRVLKRTLNAFTRDRTMIHRFFHRELSDSVAAINMLLPQILQDLQLFDFHVHSFGSANVTSTRDHNKSSRSARDNTHAENITVRCADCPQVFKGRERNRFEKHRDTEHFLIENTHSHGGTKQKCYWCISLRTFEFPGLVCHTSDKMSSSEEAWRIIWNKATRLYRKIAYNFGEYNNLSAAPGQAFTFQLSFSHSPAMDPNFDIDRASMLEATKIILYQAAEDKRRISRPFDLAGYAAQSCQWPPPAAYATEWATQGRYGFGAAAVMAMRKRLRDIYQVSGYESMLLWDTLTKPSVLEFLLRLTGARAQMPFDASITFLFMCFHCGLPSGTALNEWVAQELGDILELVFLEAHKLQKARKSLNAGLPALFKEMEENLPPAVEEEPETTVDNIRLIRKLPRRLAR
ncbi:hypothetical protein B0H17DRAFT_1145130 [Mycena rosella]|uniref:Uncharacterized protein n=1 Tax=Mycena rosella TaxID=1033263 RepID=A0AAD7CSP4_MYCRO|nr:hypothetical protein B0H17DRAFT_1145130 [Mycena rosella]